MARQIKLSALKVPEEGPPTVRGSKMKAKRLILEADSSTESRAVVSRGRPTRETGAEVNTVREKEAPVEREPRTSEDREKGGSGFCGCSERMAEPVNGGEVLGSVRGQRWLAKKLDAFLTRLHLTVVNLELELAAVLKRLGLERQFKEKATDDSAGVGPV
ncbi:hypothetical protein AXG93_483s1000 [Marchantia polymorpha subsp. ruderalis]|uniref:Uncharacterized protein n=1 Tax=Marchantia polymorpha subsp. ruderalis TaxID=1480154 RepID=A0A176WKS6_MARPO|nr:hypothetical protein AXG93_483s1000 [Marchantia polymorpha subsp. ruderalis]